MFARVQSAVRTCSCGGMGANGGYVYHSVFYGQWAMMRAWYRSHTNFDPFEAVSVADTDPGTAND